MRSLVFIFSLLFISCDPDCNNLGTWIEPEQELDVVGIHAALLSSGKVLVFGYKDGHHFVDETGRYQVWDPNTLSPVSTSQVIENWNPFCSGHSFLGDARLFIAGGFKFGDPFRSSSADKIGTVVSNADGSVTWERGYQKMEDLRWYPTVVTLANGDGLIIGGSAPFAADNWKDTNEDYEYFSLSNNRLIRKNESRIDFPQDGAFPYPPGDDRQKIADGKRLAGLYPLTHLLPSPKNGDAPHGNLFVLTESFIRIYNPSTNRIIGNKMDAGGFRTWWTQGSSVLLPIGIDRHGNGPDEVKVMLIGGGSKGTNDKNAPALNQLNVYTYNINTSIIRLTQTFALKRNRVMGDGILLPDGNVMIVGGAEIGYANENSRRIRHAELVQINSGLISKTTELAAGNKLRGYHASALLLPNGSIFVSGGNGNWHNAPVQEFKSVEIFNPPYMDGLIQPEIIDAPDSLELNEEFSVIANEKDMLPKIVLVRHGSRTHSLDTDQRIIHFEATKTPLEKDKVRLSAKMPDNPSYIPPGPYMLFVLKAPSDPEADEDCPQSHIPSKAAFVQVSNHLLYPEVMADELRVTIRTGSDNLEDDNKGFIRIEDINGSALLNFRVNPSNEELPNQSVRDFTYALPPHTNINDLNEIVVSHTAENCYFCTADNWNIDRLIVDVKANGRWENIIDLSGTPLIRLTETSKTWRTAL